MHIVFLDWLVHQTRTQSFFEVMWDFNTSSVEHTRCSTNSSTTPNIAAVDSTATGTRTAVIKARHRVIGSRYSEFQATFCSTEKTEIRCDTW